MVDNGRGAAGRSNWWLLLLVIPFIALLWPAFYSFSAPAIGGFPFFYWYQFLWVLITVALTAIVYMKAP